MGGGGVYDVFLSFRDEDTRDNFISLLFAALDRHDFVTFHDSRLSRGELIDTSLLEEIEKSRASIVVFSRRYADSRWCLDELVKIVECRRTLRQTVLPVFYNVEPSDVRKQAGCYAEAFEHHQAIFDNERVGNWRVALTEAANLSGFHLQNDAGGDEEKFVGQIVKQIVNIIKQPYPSVALHPVGVESRAQELISLLALGQDDVRFVAIWGTGGLGKTTVAKATYNCIVPSFDGCSFLADIRSTFGQVNGVVALQNQLLSNIQKDRTHHIDSYHQGIEKIKRILIRRRVLLVLDDVDHIDQLEKLAINRDFFHPGSRIIITTRNLSSINMLRVDDVYEPKKLDKRESLKLFNWYAFGEDHHCKDGYEELSEEVVLRAGGLPLVLVVWGPYFRSFKRIELWHSALRSLRKVPHNDVQGKFKVSFDSLGDKEQKLFLDIACFFIGTEKDLVVKVLGDESNACFPEIDIEILISRCLVSVNYCGQLSMHDTVRDMGREIVRQESLEGPGKRSRLWDRDDVLRVLRDCSATEAVESITLNNSELDVGHVRVEAFAKLSKLRLLHISYVHLSGTLNGMISFRRLKYLWWKGFPLECLPYEVYMGNLVAIYLQNSKLKRVWEGTEEMVNLRFLDISHSSSLIRTPDLSRMRNLEELKLHDCTNLIEVHDSVGCLDKLVVLDLNNCRKLRKVPLESIFKLKALQKFHLSDLSNFRYEELNRALPSSMGLSCISELNLGECNVSNIPSEIGSLVSLKQLDLHGNTFHILPETLSNLHHLEELYLDDCFSLQSIPELPRNLVTIEASHCRNLTSLPANMSELHSVRRIFLQGCSNLGYEDPHCLMKLTALTTLERLHIGECSVSYIPSEIGNLVLLEDLNLIGNNFPSLPASIGNLHNLAELNVTSCVELKSIQDLPPNLNSLYANNCISLDMIPFPSLGYPEVLVMEFCDCPKMVLNNLFQDFRRSILQSYSYELRLSGDEVPDWCNYQSSGEDIDFVVPCWKNRGWIICVVTDHGETMDKLMGDDQSITVKVINRTKNMGGYVESPALTEECSMWLSVRLLPEDDIVMEEGDEVVIQFTVLPSTPAQWKIKKCGLCLIFDDEKMDFSTESSEPSKSKRALRALHARERKFKKRKRLERKLGVFKKYRWIFKRHKKRVARS